MRTSRYIEQLTGSKIGKRIFQGCIFSPYLFNLYAENSMKNTRLDESQAEIKIDQRNINNSDMQMIPKVKELKSLFMMMKEESEKAGLKLKIQKTKIMLSGPITSCQIDGENVETDSDFIFLDSKITVDGDCSHKIKRHLLLGRKAMTNLDCILKSRGSTLPTKVHLVIFWCWSWNSSTLATRCKELTHLKRPWCWEGLRGVGEGDNRG